MTVTISTPASLLVAASLPSSPDAASNVSTSRISTSPTLPPPLSRSSCLLAGIRRYWTLLFPGAAAGGSVAVLATATTPAGWVAGGVAGTASLVSCVVMGCLYAKPTAEEQLEQASGVVKQEGAIADEVAGASGQVHDAAAVIHADADALDALQTRAETSEAKVSELEGQLQATREKLHQLQPLYMQLQGVLRNLTEQTQTSAQLHDQQARDIQILAGDVKGLHTNAIELGTIELQFHDTTQAVTSENQQLSVNIQAFTALVQQLMASHEELQAKSQQLQQEVKQAKGIQAKNHQLVQEAKQLGEQIASLESDVSSFLKMDAASLTNILAFLEQHETEFSEFSARQSAPSSLPV